jgi:hypothetical protein
MRYLLTALLLSLGIAFSANAQSAKSKDLRVILNTYRTGQSGLQVAEEILQRMRKKMPGLPDSVWIELGQQITNDYMIDLVMPVYDKAFTEQEAADIRKFIESPSGKKFAEMQPALGKATADVIRQWGKTFVENFSQKLKDAAEETQKNRPSGSKGRKK